MLETREAPAGILAVRDGDFAGVLTREVGAWLAAEPGLPVIASGMIGSRQGWLEAPYCACPAGSAEIAAALVPHPARPGLHFVPGLSWVGPDGVPDVIRGEETQILGEVGDSPGRRLLVLPGTHSKWALVEDGAITWFATFMTGELFAVLKAHSILGRLMQGRCGRSRRVRARARLRPRRRAAGSCGGCSARARSACSTCCRNRASPSYLSGLLIGSEIEEALACLAMRRRCGDRGDRRLRPRLALSWRARGTRAAGPAGARPMRAPGASS